jgi:hypothetical protein
MSRIRLTAVAATLLVAAAALPASAGARTYVPDCRSDLQFKPRSITVFCADAGMVARRIDWTRWTDRRAEGDSRRALANDCEPSCAEGTFHRYHARMLLRRPRTCDDGRRVFTRLNVTFVGRKWSGPRSFTQRLSCPG